MRVETPLLYSFTQSMKIVSSFAQLTGNNIQTLPESQRIYELFLRLREEEIKPWQLGLFTLQQFSFQMGDHIDPPNTLPSSQNAHSDALERLVSTTISHKKKPKGKNRNVLKFVIKLLRDYLPIVKETFGPNHADSFQRLQRFLSNLFEWHKESPRHHNISQEHLRAIFNGTEGEQGRSRSRLARVAMSRILRSKMGKLVLKNNRCKSKAIYMNALKVFQLRCSNPITAVRLSS